MRRTMGFGLASSVILTLTVIPQMADAQSLRSQACGVIVHEERVPGGMAQTPWFVTAKGLSCAKAKKVATKAAKAYADSQGKRFKFSRWSCIDKSGWVVPGQYSESRIVCKKFGSSVTLGWGA